LPSNKTRITEAGKALFAISSEVRPIKWVRGKKKLTIKNRGFILSSLRGLLLPEEACCQVHILVKDVLVCQ
jgi:hypothetical protein